MHEPKFYALSGFRFTKVPGDDNFQPDYDDCGDQNCSPVKFDRKENIEAPILIDLPSLVALCSGPAGQVFAGVWWGQEQITLNPEVDIHPRWYKQPQWV